MLWEDLTPYSAYERAMIRLRMLIYFNWLFNHEREERLDAYTLYNWLEDQHLA